jgi:hypothetical protein
MDLPHLSADGRSLVLRSKIQSVNPEEKRLANRPELQDPLTHADHHGLIMGP